MYVNLNLGKTKIQSFTNSIYLCFSEQDFNVEVKVIQADFSKGQIVFDHITKELDDIEIGILSL